MSWTLADIPDQSGRTALVTGPSVGGIGFHTALELARRGARVVLAGRNPDKLDETTGAIRAEVPEAVLEQLVVDLSDLSSVRAASAAAAAYGPLDLLVNNAGIMATPYRRTGDDLEGQLATNHFGPFLLTGLLLAQLAPGARVVTVSSQMHRVAHSAPLGDPHVRPRVYLRWVAYSQTKLANLLFTFELDRRLRASGSPITAHAAHPGLAGTHLVVNGRYGRASGGVASVVDGAMKRVTQPAAHGAWPTLMAATADVPGSTYCGPSGLGEAGGSPRLVGWSALAGDASVQRRLWELSERTTGISYP